MHIDAQRKDLLDKLHQAADDAQPPNSKLGWRGVVAIVAFAAILLALPLCVNNK